LLIAAVHGNEECVRVLIAAKADVAYANSDYGMTALHQAATYGHYSICRVLIDEGASLTAVNRYGKTPLGLAKFRKNTKCETMLEAAAAAAEEEVEEGAV